MTSSPTGPPCIGSGMCVVTAPAVFDQDDDEGLVVLLVAGTRAGADAAGARAGGGAAVPGAGALAR